MIKKRISDIADTILKKSNNEELPYIEIGDIDVETKQYISKDKPAVKGALKAKKDHVLISKVRPTRGAVTIVSEDSLVSNAFVVLQTRESIIPKYLFYSIAYNKRFFLQLGKLEKGTSYPSCRAKDILTYKIPISTISEQKEIVQKLETANNLRQKRKEQLALLDDYLKSVFLDMFGDPIANQKNWKFHNLGEFTTYVGSGSTPLGGSKVYQDSGIIFIRSQNVLMNGLEFSDVAHISLKIHKTMKRTYVKKNDVLLNITGASIGRVAIFNREDNLANVNQHVCIIRLNDYRLNPIFLSRFIAQQSFQMKILSSNSGATRQAFNFSQIKKFDIFLPPKHLQNKFASIVEQVEKTKQKMRASLDEMDDHFDALMQKYFG